MRPGSTVYEPRSTIFAPARMATESEEPTASMRPVAHHDHLPPRTLPLVTSMRRPAQMTLTFASAP